MKRLNLRQLCKVSAHNGMVLSLQPLPPPSCYASHEGGVGKNPPTAWHHSPPSPHHHSGWTIPGNQRGYVPRPARVRAVGCRTTHTQITFCGAVEAGGGCDRRFGLTRLLTDT